FDLQQQVESAMIGAGFGAQNKPFSPHITLARLKTDKPLAVVKTFLETHKNYASELFGVSHFALVESQLHPSGAIYTDRQIFALR
ncbi:MAG: RNA 2',3'-cyclic phosphodiesterase, partial [Phototrophicales bacterium]